MCHACSRVLALILNRTLSLRKHTRPCTGWRICPRQRRADRFTAAKGSKSLNVCVARNLNVVAKLKHPLVTFKDARVCTCPRKRTRTISQTYRLVVHVQIKSAGIVIELHVHKLAMVLQGHRMFFFTLQLFVCFNCGQNYELNSISVLRMP